MTAAFAAALLVQARRAYALAPPAAIDAALDGFLAAPTPTTYLAAVRALAAATRAACVERLGASTADRAFRRGLDAIRRLPHLDPEVAEVLAELPVDARAGQRLVALAQLLGAHHELAGRAAAASRAMRDRLGRPAPAPPRRASRAKLS